MTRMKPYTLSNDQKENIPKKYRISEEEKKEMRSRITDTLLNEETIHFAYVHGSFLKGEFNDIDIAVYVKDKLNKKEILDFELAKGLELSKKVGIDVDFRVLNGRNLIFLHQVLKKGELLFSNHEKKRVEFETDVYDRYLDMHYYVDQYNTIRRKRILT